MTANRKISAVSRMTACIKDLGSVTDDSQYKDLGSVIDDSQNDLGSVTEGSQVDQCSVVKSS